MFGVTLAHPEQHIDLERPLQRTHNISLEWPVPAPTYVHAKVRFACTGAKETEGGIRSVNGDSPHTIAWHIDQSIFERWPSRTTRGQDEVRRGEAREASTAQEGARRPQETSGGSIITGRKK